MSTLNNYADVQQALNDFCRNVGVDPTAAPHGAFWNTMSYTDFINGDIPNFEGVKVLIIGDAENSNIIQILKGIGEQAGNYGPMPPGVPDNQKTGIISSLSDWIVRKCPNR